MRKIIHIDMDCFYAAIEIRDNPALKNKPVAVGGTSERRGVICTCNYVARKFGIHSAMATATAYRQCPDLIVVPVNMQKYKEASKAIREIFSSYTELVEPVSLDEAYLDVTNCQQLSNSATWIAQKIRQQIFDTCKVTGSAGVSVNKFLAKVASDWHKPNGQMVIPPWDVDDFVVKLKIENIMGVGKVTAKKMHMLGLYTCRDIQKAPLAKLEDNFGSFGKRLYNLSMGVDEREVISDWERKSLSVEHTYAKDILDMQGGIAKLVNLFEELQFRLQNNSDREIHKQFVKIKFNDFTSTTIERLTMELSLDLYQMLFKEGFNRRKIPYRLVGIGVRFELEEENIQLPLL